MLYIVYSVWPFLKYIFIQQEKHWYWNRFMLILERQNIQIIVSLLQWKHHFRAKSTIMMFLFVFKVGFVWNTFKLKQETLLFKVSSHWRAKIDKGAILKCFFQEWNVWNLNCNKVSAHGIYLMLLTLFQFPDVASIYLKQIVQSL